MVVSFSFLGFGALIRDSQLNIFHGILLSGSVWALPGQVVMVSLLEEGAALLTIAVAVSLTAVRLLPMVVSLLPVIHCPHTPRWLNYLLSYFVSISVWVLANRKLLEIERPERLAWLLGVATTFWFIMLGVTVLGYHLSHLLPPILSTCLVFVTPTFFFISLFTSARIAMDYLAISAGTILGPVLYFIIPEFDFLLAGIIGGTVAYFLGRSKRMRKLKR